MSRMDAYTKEKTFQCIFTDVKAAELLNIPSAFSFAHGTQLKMKVETCAYLPWTVRTIVSL